MKMSEISDETAFKDEVAAEVAAAPGADSAMALAGYSERSASGEAGAGGASVASMSPSISGASWAGASSVAPGDRDRWAVRIRVVAAEVDALLRAVLDEDAHVHLQVSVYPSGMSAECASAHDSLDHLPPHRASKSVPVHAAAGGWGEELVLEACAGRNGGEPTPLSGKPVAVSLTIHEGRRGDAEAGGGGGGGGGGGLLLGRATLPCAAGAAGDGGQQWIRVRDAGGSLANARLRVQLSYHPLNSAAPGSPESHRSDSTAAGSVKLPSLSIPSLSERRELERAPAGTRPVQEEGWVCRVAGVEVADLAAGEAPVVVCVSCVDNAAGLEHGGEAPFHLLSGLSHVLGTEEASPRDSPASTPASAGSGRGGKHGAWLAPHARSRALRIEPCLTWRAAHGGGA
ncbi:hypothetical protein T484DRAFT_1904383, partial [Baffinella frigidus]